MSTRKAFVLAALAAAGAGSLAGCTPSEPTVAPPPPPTGVAAVPENGRVRVTWSPSAGATSYNVYYAAGPAVALGDPKISFPGPPAVVPGLGNGTAYAFAVSALNAGGESPLSAMACAMPTAADTAGLVLYDALCGPSLDGSLWTSPGAFSREVSSGAASMRVAVSSEEPRGLRNTSYGSYASVASGQRVTTLRAAVTVPASTVSRSGGADVRSVLRLGYQPPADRLALEDLLLLEVGLLDSGGGLQAYRAIYHCDDASCVDRSTAGIAFTDPPGFVPLEDGLPRGTGAQHDVSYAVEASLDEATGIFHWTVAGGSFGGGGVSGTADPSAYLATAPGWSGISLAGAGYRTAGLGVSTRDNSASGGGSGDVTARFDDVWVGFENAAPVLWDDFSGTGTNSGPTGLSPLKWAPFGAVSTLPSAGSLVHQVSLALPAGATSLHSLSNPTSVAFPEGIDTIQADVVVPSPVSGSSDMAFLQGRFYNDGSTGAGPNSAVGDVFGMVVLWAHSDTAGFYIGKCTAPACSTWTAVGSGPLSANGPILGGRHTLRLAFDPTTRRFTFGVDGNSVTVDPQVPGNGVSAPAPHASSANAPNRHLTSMVFVSPGAPLGSIGVRFNNVFVAGSGVRP
jgi:hypothetical protein